MNPKNLCAYREKKDKRAKIPLRDNSVRYPRDHDILSTWQIFFTANKTDTYCDNVFRILIY